MAIRYPIVPNTITVHLGKPSETAQNVTVSFTEYISNVASLILQEQGKHRILISNELNFSVKSSIFTCIF